MASTIRKIWLYLFVKSVFAFFSLFDFALRQRREHPSQQADKLTVNVRQFTLFFFSFHLPLSLFLSPTTPSGIVILASQVWCVCALSKHMHMQEGLCSDATMRMFVCVSVSVCRVVYLQFLNLHTPPLIPALVSFCVCVSGQEIW